MCRIERSYIDHPNGTRGVRDILINCRRGTPNHPCNDVEIVPVFEDRFVAPQPAIPPAGSPYHPATPRPSKHSHSRPRERGKPKGLGLKLNFFNPFSSKKPKNKFYLVKKKAQSQIQSPTVIPYRPRAATPAVPVPPAPPPAPVPPITRMPSRERTPNIVNIKPREEKRSPSPQPHKTKKKHRRRRDQPAILVQRVTSSSEDDAPPSPGIVREHRRKSPSPSPTAEEKAQQKYIKERERRKRAERVAQEEEQARRRAINLETHQRIENNRLQERLEYEKRRRIESAERARRRQQQEEEEEYARARERDLQELEDIRIIGAQERAARRRAMEDRRRRDEHERHRQEEIERLRRAQRAHIPRRPRHQTAVHQESMADRGETFIQEAVEENRWRENLMRFDRDFLPNARPRRTYDDYDVARTRWRPGYEGRRERRDRRSD
ncbi:hypothetical protein ACLMJK_004961 [Lecanora helva]